SSEKMCPASYADVTQSILQVVDVSNWNPSAPNGFKDIFTGSTVVFFAYVGFDVVANSAEEYKKPRRDLPIEILGSLLICAILYIGVYAPLNEAFTSKGLKFVLILINIGAVVSLTTTLLVCLYVSRLYLGLGRDGLLPAIFTKVHPTRHTPIHSQIWVGLVVAVMAGLFNVTMLSLILYVGSLPRMCRFMGYLVVSACVVTLSWMEKTASQWIICLAVVFLSGFTAVLCYRFNASFIFMIAAAVVSVTSSGALHYRQVYTKPLGFYGPGVPLLPSARIFINISCLL
ncbi:hypothetical protein MKW92_007420, partial [Papaver armeniacum]